MTHLQQRLDRIAEEQGYGSEIRHAMGLAAEAAFAWLPIDSAPNDGSYVMLAVPSFNDSEKHGFITTLGVFNGRCWEDDQGDLYDPTHWMPLPPPPKERTDEH